MRTYFLADDVTQEEEYQESVRQFVSENIKHRVCSRYVPKTENWCYCGRPGDAHSDQNRNGSATTDKGDWNIEKDTERVRPDSYGTIAFHGFGRELTHNVPYVRLDEQMRHDNLEDVWKLLSKIWRIPAPKMIVSVTGGAKNFYLKNRLKSSFKRGLINVATSSGAWIITGGTGTGVMQFVGEAVKEYQLSSGGSRRQVVALGIATWGIVDNRSALQGENQEGCFPAHYSVEELSNDMFSAPLDPNHTHFLLVDDGTEKMFGKEIEFRAGLENHISSRKKMTGISGGNEVRVPVILLVLEGGVNTLKTALEALKKNTPVVVIQGSGRAADYIAMAYKDNRNRDSNNHIIIDEEEQRERAYGLFEAARMDEEDVKAEIDKCLDYLRGILDTDYSHLVTIFHLDDVDTTKEIDQAILYALLKAGRSNAQSQLDLAILWNRCDVAKQEIFDSGSREKSKSLDLNNAMMNALVKDSADFAQLFLENGVSLHVFLTKERLRKLYDKVLFDDNVSIGESLLRRRLHQAEKKDTHTCCSTFRQSRLRPGDSHTLMSIGAVIKQLLGENGDNMYKDEKYIITDSTTNSIKQASRYPTATRKKEDRRDRKKGKPPEKRPRTNSDSEMEYTDLLVLPSGSTTDNDSRLSLHSQDRVKEDFENPERDLFLWAVLLNRQDLAKVFWKNGKDHIGGALTASALLSSRGENASKEEELEVAQELFQAASQWEEVAIGVLNECYKCDKELAHQLLVREVPTWGNRTLFSMADSGEKMDFMGHSCCQTKLNHIWIGKMALRTPIWKILLCMFLPVFLPIIRFYSETEGSHPKKKSCDNAVQPEELGAKRHGRRMSVTANGAIIHSEEHLAEPNNISFRKIFAHIYYFHLAPCTKFYYHVVSTIVFLGIFSFFLITDLHPIISAGTIDGKAPSVFEIIVWGWAGTLFIEEVRQLATKDPRTISRKVSVYFNSYWNIFDTLIHGFLLLSVILRLTLTGDEFGWARVFYSITVVLYFLRNLQLFYVMRDTGPKVIMIRRMLTDLAFLGAIMLTVITGYGVAVQTLRHPNQNATLAVFTDIFYKPYFNIYGELFIDDTDGSILGCDKSLGIEKCSEESWFASILFAGYMILTNILLLNLLIAMFSFTFQKVQENSEKVWRFHRYSLIFEYYDKPTLAPPLIIISLIWRFIKFIRVKCCNSTEYDTDFRKKLLKMDNRILSAFERACMEKYLLKLSKSNMDHIEAKVTSTSDRLEKLIEDIEGIKEQLSVKPSIADLDQALPKNRGKVKMLTGTGTPDVSVVNNRIGNLESQLRTQGATLTQIENSIHKVISFMGDIKRGQVSTGSSLLQPGTTPNAGDASQEAALVTDLAKLQTQLDLVMQKMRASNSLVPEQMDTSV